MRKLILIIALTAAAVCAYCADKTMAELNPEFEERMVQALRPKNVTVFGYQSEVPPFALYHFTDIHSDAGVLARNIAFYETYRKYFDDIICTGDMVMDSMVTDFTFWGKTPGHEKVMFLMGNHETLRDHNNWQGDHIWDNQSTMAECYNHYFAPYIKAWNVVNKPGTTYYYKDYDAKKVRFIVMDGMLRLSKEPRAAAGQLSWIKKTLAGAKEKDFSVLIAVHHSINDPIKIECNFTDADAGLGWDFEDCYLYQKAVDDFMTEGGKFVCWIGGHTHKDLILVNKAYPKQIDITVSSASGWITSAYADMNRNGGMKCQDLANALVIDTGRNLIKIIRVGANMDSRMRPRNGITLNYVTQEIISQY
ncbi:MAG: metallophosphoesterase [Abditibacteriota bacterium]|nr:metallophosphoesterase [Abditibacteriota bacterium]